MLTNNYARSILRCFGTKNRASASGQKINRPDYKSMLHKSKHSLSEIVEEDSPYIFMNQEAWTGNKEMTKNFKIELEMKTNFMLAYQTFLESVTDLS